MRLFRSAAKTLSGGSVESGRRTVKITARHLLGGAYGALLGFYIFRGVAGTLACAVIFAAVMQSGRGREQRQRLITRQAADLLESMSSMLAAGRGIGRSLTGACDELSEVYRCSGVTDTPVIDMIRASGRGRDTGCAEVFAELGKSAALPELEAFAGALSIITDKGGNSAELCGDTCDALRRKSDLAEDIVTMRTDVDLSRAILMVMVPIVLIIFSMVGPDFLSPLYTGTGRIAACASVGLIAGGYLLAGAICKKIS